MSNVNAQADLLYGRAAIIAFCKDELGLPWNERQVTWRLENGVIPSGRLGRRRIGSRQAITECILRIARGEQSEPAAEPEPAVLTRRRRRAA